MLPNHLTRTPIGPGRSQCVVPCPDMPRIGTASTWIRLKKLGYTDCYHILNTLANPPDADMWLNAINAEYHGKGKPFEREYWAKQLDIARRRDLDATVFDALPVKIHVTHTLFAIALCMFLQRADCSLSGCRSHFDRVECG